MEWAFVIPVLIGFLAGYRFQVIILILLSALTFSIAAFVLIFQECSLVMGLGIAFGMMFALQLSYLLGAAVVYGVRRKFKGRKSLHLFGKEVPLPEHISPQR